jgi:hypothetical protein
MSTIWNERNNIVFNNNKCHETKLQKVMWEGLIGYRTFEWWHVLQQIKKTPNNDNKILKAFDMVWGLHHVICSYDG